MLWEFQLKVVVDCALPLAGPAVAEELSPLVIMTETPPILVELLTSSSALSATPELAPVPPVAANDDNVPLPLIVLQPSIQMWTLLVPSSYMLQNSPLLEQVSNILVLFSYSWT